MTKTECLLIGSVLTLLIWRGCQTYDFSRFADRYSGYTEVGSIPVTFNKPDTTKPAKPTITCQASTDGKNWITTTGSGVVCDTLTVPGWSKSLNRNYTCKIRLVSTGTQQQTKINKFQKVFPDGTIIDYLNGKKYTPNGDTSKLIPGGHY